MFPLEIYIFQFRIIVIIMMTHQFFKIGSLFGTNSLIDVVFGLMITGLQV